MSLADLPQLTDLDVKNKRVFVRVDFNVPLREGKDGLEVSDDTRIRGALPTINYLLEAGAKCILASHLGRPKGQRVEKYSLVPVGQKLSELLGRDVVLTEDCIGDGPKGLSLQMRDTEILLLENLRFHPGEEKNSPEFVNALEELCDVFVSDAFGTLHRAHASTVGLPKAVEHKCIGLLVQKELENLVPLREDPKRPFGLIMGGAKVSDKIALIEHFLPRLNKLFMGGAMAYAFLKAKGHEVGSSLCDAKQAQLAARIIKAAEHRGVELLLPIDHVVAKSFDDEASAKTIETVGIPDGWMGLDIGPKTVEKYTNALAGLETLFWNGPLGVFEKPAFAKGTFELAAAVAACPAKKLTGGGDIVAAITAAGVVDQFDFISTGGGATLEFLEGKDLPGLVVMAKTRREKDLELQKDLEPPEGNEDFGEWES